MENNIFVKNLRQFRLSKKYTQEQAAEYLGVSPQAVSRWECGVTFPDVMTLPEIAKLYCVTVDDLYKENSIAYQNYADRLLSVYENSLDPKDFVRADLEFKKLLTSNDYTRDDLRRYGILHQYMMSYCMKKSIALYDEAISYPELGNVSPDYATMHQKILLYSEIGRSKESVADCLASVKNNQEDAELWACLLSAYLLAGDTAEAYDCYQKAIKRFPENHSVYLLGGDICRKLKKYEEAFWCWDKSLELDASYEDAKFSKGFCYQEMGEYENAYDVWCEISRDLDEKGLHIASEFPKQLAKECKVKFK